MYKDKDKQKEANRAAKARQRAKGMTQEGMTPDIDIAQGYDEAMMGQYDYKTSTPAQDSQLLRDWADGLGTEYQRRMGELGAQYRGRQAV